MFFHHHIGELTNVTLSTEPFSETRTLFTGYGMTLGGMDFE